MCPHLFHIWLILINVKTLISTGQFPNVSIPDVAMVTYTGCTYSLDVINNTWCCHGYVYMHDTGCTYSLDVINNTWCCHGYVYIRDTGCTYTLGVVNNTWCCHGYVCMRDTGCTYTLCVVNNTWYCHGYVCMRDTGCTYTLGVVNNTWYCHGYVCMRDTGCTYILYVWWTIPDVAMVTYTYVPDTGYRYTLGVNPTWCLHRYHLFTRPAISMDTYRPIPNIFICRYIVANL